MVLGIALIATDLICLCPIYVPYHISRSASYRTFVYGLIILRQTTIASLFWRNVLKKTTQIDFKVYR